ncbi:hypothetical protein [Acidocella aquatica]|uniref:hypothetical protein n=1 Tax=Acidocella aquatica TaxID=1922313 RepID=UPI0024E0E42F|nr:hypothetical protein [Acidocella aquatica]
MNLDISGKISSFFYVDGAAPGAFMKMIMPGNSAADSLAGYKWGLVGLARSSLAFDKFHNAFFGRKLSGVTQATPTAPKLRFLIRQKAGEKKRGPLEQFQAGRLADSLHPEFSGGRLPTNSPGELSRLGKVSSLPVSVVNALKALMQPKHRIMMAGPASYKIATGRGTGERSFAPAGKAVIGGAPGRFVPSLNQENMQVRAASHVRTSSQAEVPGRSLSGRMRREAGSSDIAAGYSPSGMRQDARESLVDISRAVNGYFMHQARLPPSGALAFDPRLTPAWAGLKLPV